MQFKDSTKATRIRIEVEAGGRKLIRIADNGHVMVRDHALLALALLRE
jgi:DNA mismatch repair protein MutL